MGAYLLETQFSHFQLLEDVVASRGPARNWLEKEAFHELYKLVR